jgi:phenylacetate-CoA ligase
VVSRAGETDVMTLRAECASPCDALRDQLSSTLRTITKLGGMSNWSAAALCRMTAR